MADDARRTLPDLKPGLDPRDMDFFELLRRLEAGGQLFGHSGRPEREPARLGQAVRLGFATRSVADFHSGAERRALRIEQAVIGLLGPEGPMPLHLTRWVLDRLSQRWFAGGAEGATTDSTFVDFANMLQHRMIALYYRAWADNRPEVQAERLAGGRLGAALAALAGTGLTGAPGGDGPLGGAMRRQATTLGHQVQGPERLTRVLADYLGVAVRLREFVGVWTPIPLALQTRLGCAHAALGHGAVIGPRSFQRQNRIELVLGPLTLAQYQRFLPGAEGLTGLRRAVRAVIGDGLAVDIRPVLAGTEVPQARIGEARIGWTSWLSPRRRRDAPDLCLHSATGRAGGSAGGERVTA
jgi:type VI secretion system protein ImpH